MKYLAIFFLMALTTIVNAQYADNPLKGKTWATLSAGLNTADNISWQTAIAANMRGETMITQMRVAYSQEFIEADDDSCFLKKNKIIELGLLWGDGWAGRRWFVTGTLGFGLNIRRFCSEPDVAMASNYISAVTLGIPAHVEFGVMANAHWGITIAILGNWNFRQPYAGAHLGLTYRK